MKRILIPTDFSDNARVACEYAISLFQTPEYQFELINGYHTPHSGASMLVSLIDIMEKDSKAKLKEEKDYLCNKYGISEDKIETHAIYGDCVTAIESFMDDDNDRPYCIVMGTKGENGLLEKIIGSNTAYVMRQMKIALISVPIHTKIQAPKHLVLATDYEPMERTENVIVPLLDLMQNHSPKLTVLNIEDKKVAVEIQPEKNRRIAPLLQDYKPEYTTLQDENIGEGIHSYLENYPSDMIAMITHDKGFFNNLFKPSLSKKMVISSHVPVLVMHENTY